MIPSYRRLAGSLFSSLVFISIATPLTAATPAKYHLTAQYAIGGDGAWDYLTIDSKYGRLYVSHRNQLEVLDTNSGKKVGVIPNTLGVHGAAIASDLKLGFSSNGGDSSVTIFDTQTLNVIKKVSVNRPDFILYDAFSRRVFPMNQKITVLDARSGESVGEVDLGGSPEGAASDEKGTLYVNIEDKNEIAVIDTKALKVTKTFPIESCVAPRSLSYDGENRLLFVGCSNGFHVVEADSGALVGFSVMCGGVDAGEFDPGAKLVFESCDEGILSVIRQRKPNIYELVQSVPTQFRARTMAFDPKTKRIYLSTADVELVPSGDPNAKGGLRSRVKPDTFRVLVLEP